MIARVQALSQFLSRNPYRKEISLIILLKLAGLTILWWFFFSKPVEEHLNRPALVSHYMGMGTNVGLHMGMGTNVGLREKREAQAAQLV